MKPQQIKNAFSHIAREADENRPLALAIRARIENEQVRVPVIELKKLFFQFLIMIIPAVVLNFSLSLVSVDAVVDLPEVETIFENGSVLIMNSSVAIENTSFITVLLLRGALRGFIILAVFAFILTAAAMPVNRIQENDGGLSCLT